MAGVFSAHGGTMVSITSPIPGAAVQHTTTATIHLASAEIGSRDNKRMEYLFLEHTFRWLAEVGVLLMVVPQERLDSAIPCLGLSVEVDAGSAQSRGARLN
jgi:hypothetical protein